MTCLASNPFFNVDISSVLLPQMITIWDNLHVGVLIMDANAICRYMNNAQRIIDDFGHTKVWDVHISKLYSTYKADIFHTLECLYYGRPFLKKNYCYKTIKNKVVNATSDFFPLFNQGISDGVITFTTTNEHIESSQQLYPLKSKKENFQRLYVFDDIIGENSYLMDMINIAKSSAKHTAPVIIWGESGTGKELFAQAIHAASPRCKHPFIPINCATVPETLFEAILFGTTKGAFTSATERPGLFEEANGGTLAFDELNSMPKSLQVKLLRALQEKKIRRLGSNKEIPVDVRIISMLNESPLEAIHRGALRRDLYYRLAVEVLSLPPLRQRKEDILPLAHAFIKEINQRHQHEILLDESVIHIFDNYDWPGNIRELRNVIEAASYRLDYGGTIYLGNLPQHFLESYRQKNESKTVQHHEVMPNDIHRSFYYDYSDIKKVLLFPLNHAFENMKNVVSAMF